MRRSAVLTTLALAASTLVLAPPALASEPLGHVPTTAKAGAPKCFTGVISADDRGRVRSDTVTNDKVTRSTGSNGRLRFDVDAWGEYQSVSKGDTSKLTMNSVTARGVRRVTLTFRKGSKIGLSSTKATKQANFKPVLFADNYYYYAYTLNDRGQLLRWTLTRYRNGDLRYASRVVVGSGYGNLTSLQGAALFEKNGVWKQPLYATTTTGGLVQITVPLKKPSDEKVRQLADSGYEGVTELSWSICNGKYDYVSLIAIDPATGIGTWTTIANSNESPKPKFRGKVTGGKGWKGVTAVY